MQLQEILNKIDVPIQIYNSPDDKKIVRLSYDSRLTQASDLFFCYVDDDIAEQYVIEAVGRGSLGVVASSRICEKLHKKYDYVTFIKAENVRLLLSKVAAIFYPKQPTYNLAVTGTNGKSSTVSIARQLLQLCGMKAASLGTLGLETSPEVGIVDALPKLTTLDSITLHQVLFKLSQAHVQAMAFEASSHGLDQARLHSVKVTAAGFTNLTQDHLDYHKTMAAYLDAKLKLFSEVLPMNGTAVINKDSDCYAKVLQACQKKKAYVITYSTDLKQSADITAFNIEFEADAIKFDIKAYGQLYTDMSLKMFGSFQIENLLCAIGLVHTVGIEIGKIIPFICEIHSIMGRMEYVGQTQAGAHVFIDYAHTPDALERALKSLRLHTKNKLHLVFGCGGNRDRGKRSLMGNVAQKYADDIIITNDNPRFENPKDIRSDILVSGVIATEISDRAKAIEEAIRRLVAGDTLLIAGKGHEIGQIINDRILPFDDKVEAKKHLIKS
jgi:UDP-N-acetylmuramoyl-L-alanyl-D-glutamate--2,6-diaminopimelate ligase